MKIPHYHYTAHTPGVKMFGQKNYTICAKAIMDLFYRFCGCSKAKNTRQWVSLSGVFLL